MDELIVNHVQAMARRVEELMAFEKFKPGSEDELRESRVVIYRPLSECEPFAPHVLLDLFLKNFVAANPSKSAYGFGLNRKKPGHSSLCFLTNKNSTIHTWVGAYLV